MAVKKEDILEIPGESEWVVTPIVWSQSRKEYNKNYYRIKFSNTRAGAPEKENFLFVSEEKLAAFKAKITKIDSGFKLTVDDDYQYGQQKEEVNRFLVYHDKERDIFQHRFVQGTLVSLQKAATEVTVKLGYPDVKVVSSIISTLVGNRLHNWK